jgi:putative ABC transport system permease protein
MIFKLAIRSILHKPLNALMSFVLLASGVALISLLLVLQEQFENRFSKNMEGIDQVMGAKGSPLQLILSAVYQIDAPTGNINYSQAKRWMDHPFNQKAIPLSYGDNYNGFRIIGSNHDYIKHFDAELAEGKMFENDFEVVIGSTVAAQTGLKLNDDFHSLHGSAETGEAHDHHHFLVTGILQPKGSLIDHLIICNLESYWLLHEHEGEDEDSLEVKEKQITAVLFKFKNKMAAIQWPRMVSENSDMQLASPAIEVNRLFTLFGIGIEVINYLGWGILLMACLSIFIGLYNNLKERKYELAIMRVSGGGRSFLLALLCLESFIITISGYLAGTLVARFALYFISKASEMQFKIEFDPFAFIWEKEIIIFLLALFIGLIAALVPALKAYHLNISDTLAKDK